MRRRRGNVENLLLLNYEHLRMGMQCFTPLGRSSKPRISKLKRRKLYSLLRPLKRRRNSANSLKKKRNSI